MQRVALSNQQGKEGRWYLSAAGAEGLARCDAHGLSDALRHFQAADGWRQPAIPGRRPRQIGDVYHLLQELGRLRATQNTARQIYRSPPVSLSIRCAPPRGHPEPLGPDQSLLIACILSLEIPGDLNPQCLNAPIFRRSCPRQDVLSGQWHPSTTNPEHKGCHEKE